MSTVDTNESTAGTPPVKPGEMRLEVVVLPVRDPWMEAVITPLEPHPDDPGPTPPA